MNGSSLMISKYCCPIYKIGLSNKINFGKSNSTYFGTSIKLDLIPCRLLKLHHERISPSIAIKPMVKHCLYSSSKDVTGSTSEVSEASYNVERFRLFRLFSIIGFALLKVWKDGIEGALKSPVWYYILLGVAVFENLWFFYITLPGLAILLKKPFSVGDIIDVAHWKDYEVIKIELKVTTLCSAEGIYIYLPNFWFYGRVIRNKSRPTTIIPYSSLLSETVVLGECDMPIHAMYFKIFLESDEKNKVRDIVAQLRKAMLSKSNSYQYLVPSLMPYVSHFNVETYCEISFICYLKPMSEEKLYLAKHEVLLQSAQIIKQHGVKLVGHKRAQKEG